MHAILYIYTAMFTNTKGKYKLGNLNLKKRGVPRISGKEGGGGGGGSKLATLSGSKMPK